MEKDMGKLAVSASATILVLTTLILACIPACSSAPDEAVGRIVAVVSGDSFGIELQITDPRANPIDSVKLADIESPSTIFPEGKAAKKYATSLLKNKTVYLDIDDSVASGRNEFNQLMCVVYLMDDQSRPVWPPVNRILVDSGYATLKDDPKNEFNSTTWWQEPVFPKIDIRSKLIDQSQKAVSENKVLEIDPNSSMISIGYRRSL
jgi:endonuclease YncB( thermonuclease family)